MHFSSPQCLLLAALVVLVLVTGRKSASTAQAIRVYVPVTVYIA